MSSLPIRAAGVAAAAACSALLVIALPHAWAAPAFDSQGYVDSTARCSDAAVLFGSTDTSRVAICKTSSGYEYRGVRVRDGAKLILSASSAGGGSYTAVNDGITYTVSSSSLAVSSGGSVVRKESWVDFHGPTSSQSSTTSSSVPTTSVAPTSTTPTSTTPLGPPLPAEVGGGGR
ncbi:hypothetical protein FHT40_001760 [Mycolicibacterium sp. BK556]|uniref:hypothetical protein n=1 Tax=Mycobacteriaceae TaxID=1762 RepID=UPI00105D4B1A|nr:MULTISPECIES: hypothetical protein [Mycobacteriaceae]MBB3602127.1 hypothetical protein [Mycolicibacterium sp. BK556]MBB3631879.1 hypothetical protein [Mycolicibacterium sp. BK607]TDO18829.1 hypothetical protein EV580_2018 [Mycobacterium sp. BK086]